MLVANLSTKSLPSEVPTVNLILGMSKEAPTYLVLLTEEIRFKLEVCLICCLSVSVGN